MKLVLNFFKYVVTGFIVFIKEIGLFCKYVFLGFRYLPSIISSLFKHFFLAFEVLLNIFKPKEKKTKEKKIKEKSKKEIKEKPKNERKEYKELLEQEEKNAYINENVKIEKENFGAKIANFGNSILAIPQKIGSFFKRKWNNLSFVKNSKNKKDLNREVLLIDFNSEDAKRSKVKLTYEYQAKNPEGKLITGYFDAYSVVEVHSYLLSEGYTVYSIRTSKWIQYFHSNRNKAHVKIKTKDLIFLLAQLSTYLKAGIPLVDSLKILTRQVKNRGYQKILNAVIYDLTTGKSFSEALAKQGDAFPRLLINMIKASEMTGQLPETLDDMERYYTESEATRKAMISAMMYPMIIFIIAIGVGLFIMLYVVPKFVEIYESMDNATIPAITLFVLRLSEFLSDYVIIIGVVVIVLILLCTYLYRNVKVFRSSMQWFLMHIPVFGNVIIYNEVTMFTKTFASLLAHNVFITDSMEILNKVTSNEVYKSMILDSVTNIAKGEKISLAFKDHWAFPLPAYEMIVTGEKTGQLPEMMSKVSSYYQELHHNSVARIKAFIEPVLIIMLTVMVGVIVLSIVVPMFNMYSAIQQ